MSDLDAKPCVADLDVRRFCRGDTKPLAMMGAALDRYLPGRNAMLANESYVRRGMIGTAITSITMMNPIIHLLFFETPASIDGLYFFTFEIKNIGV